MKLFSVIVANYNNGRYLDDLIQSVLNQTFTNWELLIADDASTDNSAEVVEKYLTDKRIKFIRHANNCGAGAAFRTAAEASTGDVIGMLGADDALVPEALKKMLEAHEKNGEAAMITSRALDCDGDLQPYGICDISGRQPEGVPLIREIHICNFVTFKRKYYNKTEGFSAIYRRGVDIDIYLKMEESGGGLAFVDEPLYLYRRHELGISQGTNGTRAYAYSLLAHVEAYKRRIRSGFTPNITAKEYKQKLFLYYQRSSYYSRIDGRHRESVVFLFKAARSNYLHFFSKNFWSGLFYNLVKVTV